MARFIPLFYATPRDAALFGQPTFDESGMLVSAPTTAQKAEAVVQACKDILMCVSQILAVHGRGVLDYAVWYRENKTEEDTYEDYTGITRLAVQCIVHTNFLAPSVTWEVVKFTAAA